MTATTLPTLNHHAAADELMNVFADGLDASVDGRGFGAEHLAARNAIVKAFADRDELVKALAAVVIECMMRDTFPSALPDGSMNPATISREKFEAVTSIRMARATLARATA